MYSSTVWVSLFSFNASLESIQSGIFCFSLHYVYLIDAVTFRLRFYIKNVEMTNFFSGVDYETSTNFPLATGWEHNDWIFIFGCTVPLSRTLNTELWLTGYVGVLDAVFSLSPAGTQQSIWMMNQPTRLSRACCRAELLLLLLQLLASHPAGGRRHSPDWCRCTECFFFLFCFFFFYNGKRATAPPSFIMQNATAIMNVFFCAKKMLLRCNVFHKRPCDNGS